MEGMTCTSRANNRGTGKCPKCYQEYSNRWKPVSCPNCEYQLGGSFVPTDRKCPSASNVLIYENINARLVSVKLTPSDHRNFYFESLLSGDCICYTKNCLDLRAMSSSAERNQSFKCKHMKESFSLPVYSITFSNEEIETHIPDDIFAKKLKSIQNSELPTVVKVSEKSYAVLGEASTSVPMCYVHVYKTVIDGSSIMKCNGNSCRKKTGHTRQLSKLPLCEHKHFVMLAQKIKEFENYHTEEEQEIQSADLARTISRKSTLELQMKNQIPYIIPIDIVNGSKKYEDNKDLQLFEPSYSNCKLCSQSLGKSVYPQGCSTSMYGNGIFITNSYPFRKCSIKIKKCSQKDCLAFNCVFPFNEGFFNISNKVMIALDILLEWREYFKDGFPLTNIISRKLKALELKTKKEQIPSDSEMEYLIDVLYNGFYAFEAITERNLNDVICGICGIVGKVYYGDGNEKNCCSMNEIDLVSPNASNESLVDSLLENESSLEDCLTNIKKKLVEKATFSGVKNHFKINLKDIPPIIPEAMRLHQYNTEMKKKSIYLEKLPGTSIEGDAIVLSDLLKDGLKQPFDELDLETIKNVCKQCSISITRKSKDMLLLQLQSLYESLIVGKSACHEFTKVPGRTGGFYHLVCPHATTVCSKFMILTESVRDAADLWLSLKYAPVLLICDTPCTFVRHMNLRAPTEASIYWGERNGCFQKPEKGNKPSEGLNIPEIVPVEFSDFQEKSGTNNPHVHPLTGTTSRFVCGDRFHSSVNPHKNELCLYHNIDLAVQSNAVKTSYQESLNNKKNNLRNRSSCTQSMMTHIFYNFLMTFYENEAIVLHQRKEFQKQYLLEPKRDLFMRFCK